MKSTRTKYNRIYVVEKTVYTYDGQTYASIALFYYLYVLIRVVHQEERCVTNVSQIQSHPLGFYPQFTRVSALHKTGVQHTCI